MGRTSRRTGIPAAALALSVLAACGSSAAKSERPAKVDISTWRAGTESGTVRTEGRSTTTTPGKPDQVQVEDGVIDFDRRLAKTEARITSGPRAGREFAVRQIGDTNYWWDPERPGIEERPWTRAAVPWAATNSLNFLDDALRGSSPSPGTRVTRTGTDTVRGDPVTTYRIEYPVSVPPRLIARGYAAGTPDFDVAVDSEGRIRRVRSTSRRAGGVIVRSETETFDYGAPVTVTAPADDEIDTSGTSASVPVATGPWTDLASDGTEADRIVVSAVPTQEGTCFAVTGTGRDDNGWWTVAGRGTDDCMSTGPEFTEMQVALMPVSTDRQVLTGQFDRGATAVTLHLDDGSTVKVAPKGGAFAAVVRGNRVVERVEAVVPAGKATCDFAPDRSPFIYRCRGNVGSIPPDIAPTIPSFDTTPLTGPGG